MQTNDKISLLCMTNSFKTCNEFLFKYNINSFDENIIVNTGIESIMPPNHKTKIYSYKWENDFSTPLNFGIEKCTGNWILRLDSDEFIHEKDVEEVYKLIEDHNYDYYLINIFTYHENPFTVRSPKMRTGFLPRLFKAQKGVQFEFIVHEQCYPSLQQNKLKGGLVTSFGIHHFGELGENESKDYLDKRDYYHKLITKQVKMTPNDARYWEFMGNYYYHKEDYPKALMYIEEACNCCHPEKFPYYISKRMELLNLIQGDNKVVNIKNNQSNISVIIPVFNELELTANILKQVYENTYIPNEVILIDNGSTENIFGLLQKFPDVKYIRNKENIGVYPAWNQGFKLVQNEIITVLNNDVIITKHFFEKIFNAMQDKTVGICCPSTVQNKEQGIDNKEQVNLYVQEIGRQGWAFTIRKSVINTIGLIPEALVFWYGDDWLFNNTRKAGYKVVQMVNNYCYHYTSVTLKKVNPIEQIQKDKLTYSTLERTGNDGQINHCMA